LKENFASGRCVSPKRPRACGARGQRPCRLTEFFPSCDKGLAEDFVRGRCVPARLKLPTCDQAMKFVSSQVNAKKGKQQTRDSTRAFRTYLKKNKGAQKALKTAIARIKRKYRNDIRQLGRMAGTLQQRRNARVRSSVRSKSAVCSTAKSLRRELKRIGGRLLEEKIKRGAVTISGAAEADAIVGLAGTSGIVFAYDARGQQRFGAQMSIQGQIMTDIDVAAGVQIGWWPGAKLTHSTKAWHFDLKETIGAPHDGLLSGPYMSVHAAVSPEMGIEIEFAVDFIFEVPSMTQKVSVDYFIDHFSGISITATAGASAIPAQFNLGAAIGNTFTVALPPIR
ncbi:MAG: hypothetical protein AAFV29_16675, partial [Myxococcota bacterium]